MEIKKGRKYLVKDIKNNSNAIYLIQINEITEKCYGFVKVDNGYQFGVSYYSSNISPTWIEKYEFGNQFIVLEEYKPVEHIEEEISEWIFKKFDDTSKLSKKDNHSEEIKEMVITRTKQMKKIFEDTIDYLKNKEK